MRVTIVGGGISGLSVAYLLKSTEPSIEIILLEASSRLGGKIWTDQRDGFLCESGVNGFLDNKPKTLEFISKLGLQVLRSSDAARRRFIYLAGRLHPLPESPGAFLTSGLLSPCGKGRLLAEVLIPKGTKDDESLAEFAVRRLGREAYENLIEPMAIGIFAGNAEELSLRSCFPRIYQLERQYGSLFRALVKLQKQAKKSGRTVGPGPGGVLTSFHQGMQTVVSRLKHHLQNSIITGKRVITVEQVRDGTYRVFTEDGQEIETDALVVACPAYETAEILKTLVPSLAEDLKGVPYPPVSVVCLGYRLEDIPGGLNGFGFLVPSKEKRNVLGVLWDSSIFEGRAPEGYALLRTMVGGARNPSVALKDDDALLKVVLEELYQTMGLDAEPEMVAIYRHERAIPQYRVGHWRLRQEADRVSSALNGLYLTGNAYRGVGFNDCIESAYFIANRFAEDFGLTPLGGKN